MIVAIVKLLEGEARLNEKRKEIERLKALKWKK